ncbi:MAG: hypothetical protein KDA96_16105 [Planctomycetaceae bacterium]|nr:hypothetical protein [Planctomycetaceae bacterium]
MIAELIVALLMLSVFSAILVTGVRSIDLQQRAIQRETAILTELQNQQQRLIARYESGEFANDGMALPNDWACSDWFLRYCPDAELLGETVSEAADAGNLTQSALVPVQLTITCPTRPGEASLRRSLVFWMTHPANVGQEVSE